MKNIIIMLLMAMAPIIEQRGAIPWGFVMGINPWTVFFVSYFGSLIPVPFILFLFNKIFSFMQRYKMFSRINNIIQRKIDKNRVKFEKYEEIALILFIAIPLPTTGVWTGTAVASFLKLDKKKSVLCAALGALISALIITMLCVYAPAVLKYFFIKNH